MTAGAGGHPGEGRQWTSRSHAASSSGGGRWIPLRRVLADGEVRLRVERFGFSSNNVTYAVIGDMLRYWDCFPASPADPGDAPDWGRVPAWGFAEVVETRSPDVVVGERLFGFLPMSTELVILAGRADDATVSDVSPHRAGLAAAYNSLRRCAADPAWRPDREELQMLLYPLFFTSFLIDDFLADQDDLGADPGGGDQRVGEDLDRSRPPAAGAGAPRRRPHLGRQRRVLPVARRLRRGAHLRRRATGSPWRPSVLVDVAGNQDVVRAVHHRLGDVLAASLIVGDTHWDHQAAADRRRTARAGPDVLLRTQPGRQADRRLGPRRARPPPGRGLERLRRLGRGLAHPASTPRAPRPSSTSSAPTCPGRVDPRVGTICTLATQEVPA